MNHEFHHVNGIREALSSSDKMTRDEFRNVFVNIAPWVFKNNLICNFLYCCVLSPHCLKL